jgi:hypothetical protein
VENQLNRALAPANFSKLLVKFLQIFRLFCQVVPNFSLAVLGDFKGLRGQKNFSRRFQIFARQALENKTRAPVPMPRGNAGPLWRTEQSL